MQDFIDLQGASGAHYWFRRWPEGSPHLRMAGNYAFVREQAVGFSVLRVGDADDLSQLEGDWPAARSRGARHLFTRLNVSRAIREAEHRDVEAHYSGSPLRAAS